MVMVRIERWVAEGVEVIVREDVLVGVVVDVAIF